MLVCHCKGLSDREVRSAIQAGACTRRAIARECGAGSVCGGCRPVIDELLDRHARVPASSQRAAGLELSAGG